MKASEAPEKIYLTTFGFPICEPIPQESSNPDTVWSEKPYMDADSIEYTRTDAFIEKACEWLSKNSPDYINYFISHDFGKFVEDFRKAQKGE